AVLKLLGNQRVAGIPGRARDELNVELRAEHDVKHGYRGRVGDLAGLLTGRELRVHDKLVAAVERYQHRAPFAIYRPVLPGRRMRNATIEFRAAEVHCEHASAHEVAHDAAFADELVAERLACRAAATVGADGISRPQDLVLPGSRLCRIRCRLDVPRHRVDLLSFDRD